MSENTLPDQFVDSGHPSTGRQRYAFISTPTRWASGGIPGGGFATADAMFRFPDFFWVGDSGVRQPRDNRNYEDDWGERYDGLAANSNQL